MAAPVLGILSSIITFAIGSLYIWWQCKRTNNKGEGFYPTGDLIDKEQLVEASVENEKPLWHRCYRCIKRIKAECSNRSLQRLCSCMAVI